MSDKKPAELDIYDASSDAIRDLVKAVDWDELQALVEKSPPPISVFERCELAVRALNGDKLTLRQWDQLVGASIIANRQIDSFALPPAYLEKTVPLFRWVVEGFQALNPTIARYASNGVILVPDFSDGRSRERYTVIARSIGDAMTYVLWLFLDPERPFGSALHECQYSKCSRFFLSKQKFSLSKQKRRLGAPPRTYCPNPECRKAGDREKSKLRARALRRKRK